MLTRTRSGARDADRKRNPSSKPNRGRASTPLKAGIEMFLVHKRALGYQVHSTESVLVLGWVLLETVASDASLCGRTLGDAQSRR